MKVADAIREATQRLSATSETARLDAEVLMAHALGVDRSELLIQRMDEAAPTGFTDFILRRAACEPVAYITGKTEFYGLELTVTRDVLIPRGDSETLIEAAQEAFAGRAPPAKILDLGTGSGALLIAAMTVFRRADGLGIDKSAEALFVAIHNAQRHVSTPMGVIGTELGSERHERGDTGAARFLQRDWRQPAWSEDLGRFDLILCNPPYVETGAQLDPDVRDFEPASALFAGEDGMDDYRVLADHLRGLLSSEGCAIFEIGASQAKMVSELGESAGFAVRLHHDLANRPRAIVLS